MNSLKQTKKGFKNTDRNIMNKINQKLVKNEKYTETTTRKKKHLWIEDIEKIIKKNARLNCTNTMTEINSTFYKRLMNEDKD